MAVEVNDKIAGNPVAGVDGGYWTRTGTVLSPTTATDSVAVGAATNATLGSDLTTNGGFTSDLAGWTGANWAWEAGTDGQARHAAGSTAALSQNINVVSGATYQVAVTITGRTAGSVVVAIGTVQMVDYGSTTSISASMTRTLVASATGSVALTVTPSTDFDGAIASIVVQTVGVGTAEAAQSFLDAGGGTVASVRGVATRSNLFIGTGGGSNTTGGSNTAAGTAALQANTTGSNNTAAGLYALRFNTTGNNNTAAGTSALYANTTGSYNTAAGMYALQANTTGSYNTAAGMYALYANTTGSYNTAAGMYALQENTTGSSNVAAGLYALSANTMGSSNTAAGQGAGRYQADGATALADPVSSTYIGANTRGKDNNDDHTTVIGADAIGQGANTVTLGGATVTRITLANNTVSIAFGAGSPEGVVTARVGSLFLRTDGGANTTLYVKESGTGNTGWMAK